MRSVRPVTFSSAIWYFALQLPHRNFIALLAYGAPLPGGPSLDGYRSGLTPSVARASEQAHEVIADAGPRVVVGSTS